MNNRIGEMNTNNYGSHMEIVEYYNNKDVWVKFLEHGNLVHTQWVHFYTGVVKNPYDKEVFGIGYLGEGNYKSTNINGKGITSQYNTWRGMLQRCYSEKEQERQPAYKGVTVCEEWHNFQTFAEWYDENFYQIDGQKMELDKDILIKGNKIYSPFTCVFVPSKINSLFVKKDSVRGKLPIGVSWNNQSKKYQVVCRNRGVLNTVGHYKTITEAFQSYKEYKENLIKEIADEYKNRIPEKLYKAMYTYEVEVSD